MRHMTEQRSYVGSRAVVSRHGQVPASRTACRRRGFTLIEVVVAMSILVVVVLALLSSYTFYYRSITNLRIQSIGENLAQLQLEDVRNMGVQSLGDMLGGNWDIGSSKPFVFPARSPSSYDCPNYPPAELFYTNAADPLVLPYWYSYSSDPRVANKPIGLGNLPLPWVIPTGPEALPISSALGDLENNLASVWYKDTGVPFKYDSGERDADFVVERLTDFVLNGSSTNPSELVLPDSITVTPSTPSASYTLDISKWAYPYYKKRVTIEDKTETPGGLAKALKERLYEVSVTVYWTANGAEKSVTVKQEVSFEGQT